MGRIDASQGQDKTLERRHITAMLRNFEEYEQIKAASHKKYKIVTEFFEEKSICKQNFHKYYKRYVVGGRQIEQLLPKKRGCRFKDAEELYTAELIEKSSSAVSKDITDLKYSKF